MFKNLDKEVVYEKRLNWKTTMQTDGITEFKEHLNSPEQNLCNKNFKIRSCWTFNLSNVNIGVKYFPISTDIEKQPFQKYGQIGFTLEDNRIIAIVDES